jgi:carbonic anhydrase
MVGYKLARVQLFKTMYKSGYEQFVPFIATIVGVLLTDLLKGIFIGIAVAIFYILRRNFRHNYTITETETADGPEIHMDLAEEVTFLNKASIVQYFYDAPEGVSMIIDGSNCKSINHDVLESITEFKRFGAPEKRIKLTVVNIPDCEIC